ncbi:lysophosphatidic acid receptor 6-like [Hydractinia symbiolongicarpus]|uniref:lysophosphatidic acid receptor 6-like n=1 Tax=Hydractinia symbiolongicarpus TaxID=13093 RepID=UPI00254DE641|nr:lysophosphatidic acid receptor 6-like [Hydractinia symbiolongicarpus]
MKEKINDTTLEKIPEAILEELIEFCCYTMNGKLQSNSSNETISLCAGFYSTCHDGRTEEDGDFSLIAQILMLTLSIAAFLLNSSVIIYFKMFKHKKQSSEYVLLSFSCADAIFAFVLTLALAIPLAATTATKSTLESFELVTDQIVQFSIYASVFYVLAITLERFCAVIAPFKYSIYVKTKKRKKYIFVIWILTLSLQGIMAIVEHVGPSHMKHEREIIVEKTWAVIVLVCGFTCFVVYSLTFIYLSRAWKITNKLKSRGCSKKEKIALITAVLMAIGFLIFTVPISISMFYQHSHSATVVAVRCLFITNAIFNPVVYFWRGQWIKRKSQRESQSTTMHQSIKASEGLLNTLNTNV